MNSGLQTRPQLSPTVVMAAACLIAIPLVVAPSGEPGSVARVAVTDMVALTSSLADLLDPGGDGATSLASAGDVLATGLLDLGGVPDLAAVPTLDPITDWFTALAGSFAFVYAFILGPLIVIPVMNFLNSAWEWIADLFGFDPYPAVEALAAVDPGAVGSDLGSALDLGTSFDTAGMTDFGTALSGLSDTFGF